MSKTLEDLKTIAESLTRKQWLELTPKIENIRAFIEQAEKEHDGTKKKHKVIIHDDIRSFECTNCVSKGVNTSVWIYTETGEYKHCPECGCVLDWTEDETID